MASPPRAEPARGRVSLFLGLMGRRILGMLRSVQELGAFGLITLAVAVTKFRSASKVIHPLVIGEIYRAGLRLLPMTTFLALALGFVVIGQTVSLLTRLGAVNMAGTIMVMVVVRELGPLVAALLVLARVGTAIVIELGYARAMGEVEALEALAIDPIHYLVVPRMAGLVISILSLTVYLILGALLSGYFFAFLQDVPLPMADYFEQLASALTWQDLVILALKTAIFGGVIALVTCYRGLARPLRLEDIGRATTRALMNSVILCVLVDAFFIIFYLLL